MPNEIDLNDEEIEEAEAACDSSASAVLSALAEEKSERAAAKQQKLEDSSLPISAKSVIVVPSPSPAEIALTRLTKALEDLSARPDPAPMSLPPITLHMAAPVVNVTVPETVVNVQTPAPVVTVEPPDVTVNVEAPAVNVAAPDVTVNVPPAGKTVTEIERNAEGEITRTTTTPVSEGEK